MWNLYITKGAIIPIEVVARDSTSPEGWTRCYNSGVTRIAVCIDTCWTDLDRNGDDYVATKCFEIDPFHDGDTIVSWNTSGLEFDGCSGCYELWVKAWDCLGNHAISDPVQVTVRDTIAPVTTVAGFDGNYIYGYSDEKVDSLLFQYADSGTTGWIPIGWSSYIGVYTCTVAESLFLYKTSWNPCVLTDGVYQVRIISHDTCSNQDDSKAPWAYITVENCEITPHSGDLLGPMAFLKNWCVGGVHGVVVQDVEDGTPIMLTRYLDETGNYSYECVHMQAHQQDSEEYAGSFYADPIQDGGSAMFFSSITIAPPDGQPTGEPAMVTYLRPGTFDLAKVKCDLGTHGTYQEGCVELTIPDGAIDCAGPYAEYVWVSPTFMEWAPVTQPDILPIGDNDGYATYVSFTDCHYCCGWGDSPYFGENDATGAGAGSNSGRCCFNDGKYAKIKMCYDSGVDIPEDQLAVAWWDCRAGEYKFDNIFYPSTVEGFNTDEHYVEFATECLKGPFVVVRILERECDGSIVVNMLDVEPYCMGADSQYYTNTMPFFKALITDNIQGTAAIDTTSIQFKIDLFNPGELIRIYDGAPSDICDRWMPGFGSFQGSGYDDVSGIFRAGWNDTTYYSYNFDCEDCFYGYYSGDYYYYCRPMYSLTTGDHMATVTAMNSNIQTCTDTVQFKVDDTDPEMWFADSVGAWVGANPHLCIYFKDTESGVDKSSVWIDIYGDETTSPDPNNHSPIGTLTPAQLDWVDDTTACLDFTFDYEKCGYLHIFVYGGTDCRCGGECAYPDFYDYHCGISDCVGNHTDVFWQYYSVDAEGPTITFVGDDWCDLPLMFEITDKSCYQGGYEGSGSGLHHVYVYEDSTLVDSIEQDPHNPDFWYYTPSDGPHHVDIKAVDNIGNETVRSFDLTADCLPPVLTFVPGYVSCDSFEISFILTDAGTGVNWDMVNLDLYYSSNYILTYDPVQIAAMKSGDTVTVTVTGDDVAYLQLYNGALMNAVVYSEKNYGTSYAKGPQDMAENYETNVSYFRGYYYADCSSPSISWENDDDPCDWPVLLDITDSKSGVADVMVYEDGMEYAEALMYNETTELWEYTPAPGGMHVLDIVATDMVGNTTPMTIEVRDDCIGPAVSFGDDYVTKNPTLKFWVKDQSGVDWTTVHARVTGCSEECYYRENLVDHADTMTGEVMLEGCNLDCSDGEEVEVYVFSGTSYTGKGPADKLGNFAPAYSRCSFVVDAVAPECDFNSLSERPIVITLWDERSGVDWSTLEIMQDSVVIWSEEDTDTTVTVDITKGTIEYLPPAGRLYVEIYVEDYAGNPAVCWFYTEEEQLSFKDPHNYPNPFDPRDGRTTIILGLSKSAYVTAKIYDFAGEYVTSLQKDKWTGTSTKLYWDGTTEDGTGVGNGTYLCHVKARDTDGAMKTAVIKITVLKEDK